MYLKKSEDYLPYLKNIVNYIEESISIYKDCENEKQQLNSIIHLLDELNSYYKQTKDQRLIKLYKDTILKNLDKAEYILEKSWKQPNIEEYIIPIAWFSYQFKQDKILSSKWLNRFDSLNQSLNHYGDLVAIWYLETKKWLKLQEDA